MKLQIPRDIKMDEFSIKLFNKLAGH
jgi:hypothetical protein